MHDMSDPEQPRLPLDRQLRTDGWLHLPHNMTVAVEAIAYRPGRVPVVGASDGPQIGLGESSEEAIRLKEQFEQDWRRFEI